MATSRGLREGVSGIRLQIDHIDRTVQTLYQAALDEASWLKSISELALLTGASHATLYDTDLSNRAIYRQHLLNVSAADSELYLQRYAAMDPRLQFKMPLTPQWFSDHDTFDAAFRGKHPFYVEYQHPRGAGESLFSVFPIEGSRIAILSLTRSNREPKAGKVVRDALDRLFPHVDRAIRISRQDASLAENANLSKRVLNHLEEPLCCVEGNGRVRHMNAAFGEKLREGSIVSESRGKLRFQASHTQVMRAIQECSQVAQTANSRSGEARRSFIVSSKNGARAFVTIAPLAGAPEQSWRDKPCALLRIDEFNSHPQPQRLRQALGMSAAEARLVSALCHGGSLATAAKEVQISLNTAKTQLASVFAKTGTRRQSELIALVSALPR